MSSPSAWQRLTGWVPGLRLFSEYDRGWLPGDLTAGLVVALVVIPSAIAYADLANCPPIAGLYAALGGMVAFALFTSSRHVIVGPDAAIAILVGAAVGPLSRGDPGKPSSCPPGWRCWRPSSCCWPAGSGWAGSRSSSPAR